MHAPLIIFRLGMSHRYPPGVQHGYITTYPRGMMRKENKLVLVNNRTSFSEISITGGSLISIFSIKKTGNRWRFCDSDFFYLTKSRNRWFFDSVRFEEPPVIQKFTK
jgi:hypothetical protein